MIVSRRSQVDVFNPESKVGTVTTSVPILTAPAGAAGVTGGLTFVGYTGTTIGSGTVGTISFTGAAQSFNFFNFSSSTAVSISADGVTWLPLGSNGNWPVEAPGGFANAAPFTELYHKKTTSGSSNFAVAAWEA